MYSDSFDNEMRPSNGLHYRMFKVIVSCYCPGGDIHPRSEIQLSKNAKNLNNTYNKSKKELLTITSK